MSQTSVLRRDILPESIITPNYNVRVIGETIFNLNLVKAVPVEKTTSIENAKDIDGVIDLIFEAVNDYQDNREKTTADRRVNVIYENPDTAMELETISISCIQRVPGMFGRGSPGENKIQNRVPMLREVLDDPDHPGYKRAILGYFYDNILRLTCWARTNKTAMQRAIWLEKVMDEYTWYFVRRGINRILYNNWATPETLSIGNNKYYGRPIDYYVRTEKIQNISQKELEQICVRLSILA